MDNNDLLLLAILTGAIPLDNPRADLGRFNPGELLGEMNEGNDAFDLAAIKQLSGRQEELNHSEMTWLWSEINEYQSRTGDASLMTEQTAIGLALSAMLYAANPDKGFFAFLDACLDVIVDVPPLRANAEKLLEAQVGRIGNFYNLLSAFGAYEDAKTAPPEWLSRRATILLADNAVCEIDQIEELAELSVAKPVALAAYRTRIASLCLALLLDLAPEDIAFAQAWYEELFKPNRKAEIAELLGTK